MSNATLKSTEVLDALREAENTQEPSETEPRGSISDAEVIAEAMQTVPKLALTAWRSGRTLDGHYAKIAESLGPVRAAILTPSGKPDWNGNTALYKSYVVKHAIRQPLMDAGADASQITRVVNGVSAQLRRNVLPDLIADYVRRTVPGMENKPNDDPAFVEAGRAEYKRTGAVPASGTTFHVSKLDNASARNETQRKSNAASDYLNLLQGTAGLLENIPELTTVTGLLHFVTTFGERMMSSEASRSHLKGKIANRPQYVARLNRTTKLLSLIEKHESGQWNDSDTATWNAAAYNAAKDAVSVSEENNS